MQNSHHTSFCQKNMILSINSLCTVELREGQLLTHMQISSMEVVLSQQHAQAPTQEVHAQTAGTDPEAILGEPGAIEEVTHVHHDCAEPDM